jgi:ATP-dependent DNA helicase RecQ
MLALTATANMETQKLISKSLCLRQNYVRIYLSPNRKNIFLYKRKVTTNVERAFQWLVDKLLKEKISMPKTIVYCKSIRDCGRLFTHFKMQLGIESFYPETAPKTSENLLFGMYHHATLEKH